MLAYLCVVNNPADDLRLRRIINTPARGIGGRTVELASGIAQEQGLPLYEVVKNAKEYAALQKSVAKLQGFTDIMEGLRAKAEEMELPDFYEAVMTDTGYLAAMESKRTIDSRTRVENIKELKSSIQGYMDNHPDGDLAGFLDEVALYSDLDNVDSDENTVTIMTMHSAKGLEFPAVFVVGMEDGLFPGTRSIGEPEEMEEERRLCYVALTRARENLYVSCAHQRMLFGHTTMNKPSRFLDEIPEEYLEKSGRTPGEHNNAEGGEGQAQQNGYGGGRYGGERRSGYSRRRPRRDDGKPLGGGISVNHAVAPTGHKAVQATFNLLSQFHKGDEVDHTAFGKGTIQSILPMGGDALVSIKFDDVGVKNLMLKAACQHMKNVTTAAGDDSSAES
jgi:DNA helicase-2/ATP-dependent DNA helicase PcrA